MSSFNKCALASCYAQIAMHNGVPSTQKIYGLTLAVHKKAIKICPKENLATYTELLKNLEEFKEQACNFVDEYITLFLKVPEEEKVDEEQLFQAMKEGIPFMVAGTLGSALEEESKNPEETVMAAIYRTAPNVKAFRWALNNEKELRSLIQRELNKRSAKAN